MIPKLCNITARGKKEGRICYFQKIINDEGLIEHLDFFIDERVINMNTFTYKSFKENKTIPLGKSQNSSKTIFSKICGS